MLPVHSGGNIRSYHILRQLASCHEVCLLSYYGGTYDVQYEDELRSHFPGAVGLFTGKTDRGPLRRGVDYLLHLVVRTPYAVSRFASAPVRRELRDCFQQRRFDIVVCDFLDAAVNFPAKLIIPSVLFQHNVESEIWRRHAMTEQNLLKKLVYRVELARMLRYEQEMVRKFDHVIAVSEHDRQLMSAWVDARRITVVPTGVDVGQYRPDFSAGDPERVVMFVGAMDWVPNVDAVEYFCRDIWPAVQDEVPEARFRIVGRNPGRRIQELASSSIEVTGSVISVVEQLRQAAVVVVPLRVGGGTRLKIYEAMAAGKAVVSTSVGAEGLDVHDGHDVMLRDDSSKFAEAVTTFLQDRELRRGYEHAAAELAAQYDWPVVAGKFSHVLETTARAAALAKEECVAAPQV